jgi:hypothetical protein
MQYLKSYQKKKNKVLHLLSQYFLFFLFFVENQYTEKQQRHAYGKGNDI